MHSSIKDFFQRFCIIFFIAVLMIVTAFNNAYAQTPPIIDSASYSGVAGYTVGIFGTNFGMAGTVNVLGVNAQIVEWTNTMVRFIVPRVTDGSGNIILTTSAGSSTHPFTVYSVNPLFLQKPKDTENLALGKGVYFYGATGTYEVGNSPTTVLTRNGSNPWGGGYVDFKAPAILAINLGTQINDDVWFSFYGDTDWYSTTSVPQSYVIESTNSSVNGQETNGWTTLLTVSGNDKKSRVHKVSMPGHSWIRLRVTAGTFRIREIRVHRAKPGSIGTGIDSLAVFGDSITTYDLDQIRDFEFLPSILSNQRNNGTTILYYVIGMVGQNATALENTSASTNTSIARALSDNPDFRYWGIAIGTNDSQVLSNDYYLQMYKSRVAIGLNQICGGDCKGANITRVPMIARIPDTTSAGFGDLRTKNWILKSIDELNAEYRLIPGPDFYTEFRKNIMFNNASYISDGTHHGDEGGSKESQLWTEALYKSGIYQTSSATPTTTLFNSLTPTSSPMLGDANGDGSVDGEDYLIWLNHYNQSIGGTSNGDFDGNSRVDGIDYIIWITNCLQ